MSFDICLSCVLRAEGGFVNNPKDPGGMTNLGVTKRTWESWTGKRATEEEMRALTPELASPLYRASYWTPLHCDELPLPLALCVFDFGVNAGVKRAGRFLQAMVGAKADGILGPASMAAVSAWLGCHTVTDAVHRYQEARRSYYRQLPTFADFGRGWLRRVDDVQAQALRLIP
jgi:lysozyme family protein